MNFNLSITMSFCYQKNFSNPTLPVDEAQFWALVRATEWAEKIDKFRETGDASLKRKLPAFIFQATFDETKSAKGKVGAWRKQAATRLTGLVVMDIDHVEEPKKLFEEWKGSEKEVKGESKGQYLKDLGILLIYITPSGKGLKIVFKADVAKGNLIANQHAMAEVLGVVVDESCKDSSRMSFICKESDILYLDKELFTYENKEFAEKYNAEYRAGHSRDDKADTVAHKANEQGAEQSGNVDDKKVEVKTFKGIPYEQIIEEWWNQNGGVPQEGERNVKLYQLAVSLRAICDNSKKLVLSVVPRLGLDDLEVERIVDSACKEPPKGVSKALNSVLEAVGLCHLERSREISPCASLSRDDNDEIDQWLWDWGERFSCMFDDFPILKDICKGLKKNQYPAAIFVAGGLLMTLMTRCCYRFYHRPQELRRLNNSTLIIGDPASGKSFATRLYALLAAPIEDADQAGKDAINNYREEMRTKGANKEKPKKPKVVVRAHPARTSNAQFIQDMVNAVEEVDGKKMQLHMLTFDTELDNTLSIQKGGSWIDKMSLELKAFHNEVDGQAYSNNDSVIQNFSVTWNYIYTGTPNALKKKVNEQNFGSGLATRLSCIPLPATNFEMMDREEDIDYESDERLKEWAVKLDRTKGELNMKKIVDELYDWTARRMADAKEDNSHADEMLLKRCAYHGINFSTPFIVMRHWDKMKQDGSYWCGEFETDEVDWKLAELLVNVQYACQRYFFGGLAQKYFDDKKRDASYNSHRKSKSFDGFNRLPEEFVVEDVMRCFNLANAKAARARIIRMTADNLIVKVKDINVNGHLKSTYRKTGTIML
ncbi:BT4734/BF3469 family protein [Xylanibacter ruminicola]|nr:BT4734/BF3469 family protein [Xylanibacter ruminicola]